MKYVAPAVREATIMAVTITVITKVLVPNLFILSLFAAFDASSSIG
jgi:hypothetical protein